MKKLLAILLAAMMVFALAACGEQGDGEISDKDGEKTNAEDIAKDVLDEAEELDEDIAKDVLDEAEELDSFSEAAVEHYLKSYGISYEELKPDWEYEVSENGAYADDPASGSGHAVVIFKTPDSSELTDEQIKEYYEQVFKVTAAASDDGYNIIGHEFVGEGENPDDETTLEDALSGFLQGWCFRKDGKSMAVYVSDIYDNDKDSELDRLFYSYGVKFDIGIGLQKSFDDTWEDMEEAFAENEEEIMDALEDYMS